MKPQPHSHNQDYLKPHTHEDGRKKNRYELLKKMNNVAYSIAGIFEQDFRNIKQILK